MADEIKACSKCGQSKPLTAFHVDPKTPDGRRAICKACRLAQEAARRERSGDQIRAQQREYYQRTRTQQCAYQRNYRRTHRAELRAYFAAYRQRHPEIVRAGRIRWNDANPEKRAAHSQFWSALRKGVIPPPPNACTACATPGYVEAHHDDYSKPLEVRWLCELCHVKADEARRRSAA